MTRSWPLVAIGIALLATGGCADPYAGTSEDEALFDASPLERTRITFDPLVWMPTNPGRTWQVRSAWRSLVDGTYGERQEIVTANVAEPSAGVPALVLRARDRRGRLVREEWMVDRPDGRSLVRTRSGSQVLRFDPPFPLLPASATRGQAIPWTGTLRTADGALEASGWMRFRGIERVRVRGKETDAACIETVLRAQGDTGMVEMPTRRWFVRNQGPIRVWFQLGPTEHIRETQ